MISYYRLPCRRGIIGGRALTAAAVGIILFALSGCATTSGSALATHSRPAAVTSPPVRSPTASPSASTPHSIPVAPGAGLLAQTGSRPKAHGRAFHAMVTDLWLAVRRNKPSFARPAFFPLAAYKQVKAISNSAADWRSRLWLDFSLDVRAAHRLLGHDAGAAKLVRVIVPSGAAWITPGVCYNKVGYWHVAGPRVVYRQHGRERSFGIASLISWRGVWYVVHFGGITRPAVGMVDSPASGPGSPGPQGGC